MNKWLRDDKIDVVAGHGWQKIYRLIWFIFVDNILMCFPLWRNFRFGKFATVNNIKTNIDKVSFMHLVDHSLKI